MRVNTVFFVLFADCDYSENYQLIYENVHEQQKFNISCHNNLSEN